MDMRDKQFDNWIQNSLEIEIPFSKQTKQTAWEQLQLKISTAGPLFEPVYTAPVTKMPLVNRVWDEILRLFTQEKYFYEARAKSVQHCKPQTNYLGGLSLHNMELMRQRWAFPV